MAQVARNLIDCADGFLRDHRFLILDRDSKFTEQFKRILKDAGTEVVSARRKLRTATLSRSGSCCRSSPSA